MTTTIDTVLQSDTFDTWRTTLNETIDRWNVLGESGSIVITGGSINGTPIGGTTPSTGIFTNISATGTVNLSAATITLADNQISGDKISGGTIDANYIVLANDPVSTTHAVRKSYVDNLVGTAETDGVIFSLAL